MASGTTEGPVEVSRERFLSEWQSTHVARLTSVVNALHEAAQRATANANEQEQVSSR